MESPGNFLRSPRQAGGRRHDYGFHGDSGQSGANGSTNRNTSKFTSATTYSPISWGWSRPSNYACVVEDLLVGAGAKEPACAGNAVGSDGVARADGFKCVVGDRREGN